MLDSADRELMQGFLWKIYSLYVKYDSLFVNRLLIYL